MLDVWAEEDLKTGSLSNGTVGNYLQAVNRIKPVSYTHLISDPTEHPYIYFYIKPFTYSNTSLCAVLFFQSIVLILSGLL